MEKEPRNKGHFERRAPSCQKLVAYGRGLDKPRTYWHDGANFEDKCFKHIGQSTLPPHLVLGPNVVNDVLGSRTTASLAKPDAIEFRVYSTASWIITQLHEIKGGKNLNKKEKLKGFSELLQVFREFPMLLPTALGNTIGNQLTTPSTIIIPPDNAITVSFMSPYCQNTQIVNNSAFPQRYQIFP